VDLEVAPLLQDRLVNKQKWQKNFRNVIYIRVYSAEHLPCFVTPNTILPYVRLCCADTCPIGQFVDCSGSIPSPRLIPEVKIIVAGCRRVHSYASVRLNVATHCRRGVVGEICHVMPATE